jgi:protein O-GlcNAc transferase
MNQQLGLLLNESIQYLQQGLFDAAAQSIQGALQIAPENADAFHILGIIRGQQNKPLEAVEALQKAAQLKPSDGAIQFNLAKSLMDCGRNQDALIHHANASQAMPNNPDIWINYGKNLKDVDNLRGALDCFEKAIQLQPNDAVAWSNKGVILNGMKKHQEALNCYQKSIALQPHYAEAFYNQGIAFSDLERHEDALHSYEKALALVPKNAKAWSNKGICLSKLDRPDEALASYDQAIQIDRKFLDAWINKGICFAELKLYDQALASYQEAIKINPDADYLLRKYLHTKMLLCDWEGFSETKEDLIEKILQGRKVAHPFSVIPAIDSASLQFNAAKIWANDKYAISNEKTEIAKRSSTERIRIAYFSADFHNHATAHLISELLELHDSSQFEIHGFSFGPNSEDTARDRIRSAFDHFHDVGTTSDQDIVALARKLGIDIAIDLKGYTQNCRPAIFSLRAAPIQISYLGYPGTLGLSTMDYMVADPTLIPIESRAHYSEKIIYLPESYQANDSKRAIANLTLTRADAGLPDQAFVFCCFNNNYKITPDIFDSWMKILQQTPGSVLWLLEDNPYASRNLQFEANKRNVEPKRLVFAKKLSLPEHLARHQLADLFLDTLPCNAHTTASDALWAGLPIITILGNAFPGRVAASLLNAIGMPELITNNQGEYEALAIHLAGNRNQLSELKNKLASNRNKSPLFNTPLFTKHLEAAYLAAYKRYQSDLKPDHIYIS